MRKITVDAKKCLGCGTCMYVAPKTFKLGKNGKVQVISQTAGSDKEVKEAVASCPVGAISLAGD